MQGALGTTVNGSFELWEIFFNNETLIGRKMLSASTEEFDEYRKLPNNFLDYFSFEPEAIATTFDVLLESYQESPE